MKKFQPNPVWCPTTMHIQEAAVALYDCYETLLPPLEVCWQYDTGLLFLERRAIVWYDIYHRSLRFLPHPDEVEASMLIFNAVADQFLTPVEYCMQYDQNGVRYLYGGKAFTAPVDKIIQFAIGDAPA